MSNSIDPSHGPESGSFEGPTCALALGATLGLLGVGLGAFGAHGLEGLLEKSTLDAAEQAKRIGWWETAAQYQLLHAVLLVAMGATKVCTQVAPKLTAAGVVVFSGTLYAMALGAPRWLGAITPIGGLLLMAGWLLLLLGARPRR